MTAAGIDLPPWRLGGVPESLRAAETARVLASRVSPVPVAMVSAIAEEGLVPGEADALACLTVSAQDWIRTSPELEAAVLAAVTDVHPLAAEPGYDVSHSQPRWRSRIFVSCPERTDCVGALRLAESVVHEAMHLRLTNEEGREPFVASPAASSHSPWRRESRPVQGVLHGLFVFACIARFMRGLRTCPRLTCEGRSHVEGRMATIAGEIADVDSRALSASLTARGRKEVAVWLFDHPRDGQAKR